MVEHKQDICVLVSRYGECEYYPELVFSLNNQTIVPTLNTRRDGYDEKGRLGIKGSFRQLLSQVTREIRYVCFCDQDDVWLPHKVETLLRTMIASENTYHGPLLVHCDAFVTNRNLLITKRRFISKWARRDDFFGTLMFNKVQGASSMINRPLLELVQDLPEEGPAYDRYIHLVAEIFGKRVFIDRPLMYYRQHGGNAIGAYGPKPHLRFEFFNEDEKALFIGNEYVLQRFGEHLSPEKKRLVRDYKLLFSTRNPFVRLKLIARHLRFYPGTMIKKLAKLFFP